eukprot:TRINITY_DN3683_c0_g1_i1.p1 TRINITY_DN3683_c0_g1~~TRINITY_DN3683_c0_g1_i1.p1  ORF type:complete len:127 (+),score=21.84 TRINITY_DN3683_c0_g1_i1:2-382(+)
MDSKLLSDAAMAHHKAIGTVDANGVISKQTLMDINTATAAAGMKLEGPQDLWRDRRRRCAMRWRMRPMTAKRSRRHNHCLHGPSMLEAVSSSATIKMSSRHVAPMRQVHEGTSLDAAEHDAARCYI